MEELKNDETITESEKVKTTTNWLEAEAEAVKETSFDGEKKPSLKLEENKITEITVDFSEPFQTWEDNENETIKKIIPVTVKGVSMVWWLNRRNPIYNQIIKKGAEGKTLFKVLQTGSQKNTKYTLVEE